MTSNEFIDLRKRIGRTQEELSNDIGVSRRTIANIENGIEVEKIYDLALQRVSLAVAARLLDIKIAHTCVQEEIRLLAAQSGGDEYGQRMRYLVYRDKSGSWRWTLYAANNKQIAVSSDSYANKSDCIFSIGVVRGSQSTPLLEL